MNKYQEALNILINIFAEFDQGVIVDITPIKYKKGFASLMLLQELVDKETPKKPKTMVRTEKSFVNYECPNCDVSWGFTDTKVVKYCPNCGQHLDWSEENE